jgi:hypothetical protein
LDEYRQEQQDKDASESRSISHTLSFIISAAAKRFTFGCGLMQYPLERSSP